MNWPKTASSLGSVIIFLRISVDTRADIAGAAARCRFTNRNAQGARHHRFNRDFISSGVLRRHRSFLSAPSLFLGGIRFACAHCSREALLVSCYFRQLRAVPSRRNGLLFLVAAQNDSLFLSRHREAGLGAHLDRATILFFRHAIYHRLWSRIRIAGGGPGARSIWIDHLPFHGAHPALRRRAHFYPGYDHYPDAGYLDLDRIGAPDVSALRKLHLDCLDNGAP